MTKTEDGKLPGICYLWEKPSRTRRIVKLYHYYRWSTGVGWGGVAWGSAARVSPERREGVGERRGEEVGAHSLLLHLILISTEGIPKLQRLLISAFNSGLNKFSSKADQNLALQL